MRLGGIFWRGANIYDTWMVRAQLPAGIRAAGGRLEVLQATCRPPWARSGTFSAVFDRYTTCNVKLGGEIQVVASTQTRGTFFSSLCPQKPSKTAAVASKT